MEFVFGSEEETSGNPAKETTQETGNHTPDLTSGNPLQPVMKQPGDVSAEDPFAPGEFWATNLEVFDVSNYLPNNAYLSMRRSIADFFERNWGTRYTPEQVMYNPTGISGLWVFYLHWLEKTKSGKKDPPHLVFFESDAENGQKMADDLGCPFDIIPDIAPLAKKRENDFLPRLQDWVQAPLFFPKFKKQYHDFFCFAENKKIPLSRCSPKKLKALVEQFYTLFGQREFFTHLDEIRREHPSLFFYYPHKKKNKHLEIALTRWKKPLILAKTPQDINDGCPWKGHERPVVLMPEVTYGLATRTAQDNDLFFHEGFEPIGVALDENYRFTAKNLEKTIEILQKQGRTIACLKLDNPHNPTGHILTASELKEIAKVCKKYHISVFEDLAYAMLEYKSPVTSIARYYYDVTSVFSLSKAACAAKLRAGVAATRNPRTYDFLQKEAKHFMGPSLPGILLFQKFADPENTAVNKFLEKNLRVYDFRRRLMLACIVGKSNIPFSEAEEKHISDLVQSLDDRIIPNIRQKMNQLLYYGTPGIRVINPEPEAGFYLVVQFDPNLGTNSADITKKIKERNGPPILPSTLFTLARVDGSVSPAAQFLGRITFSKSEIACMVGMLLLREKMWQLYRNKSRSPQYYRLSLKPEEASSSRETLLALLKKKQNGR